jgi:uncharacterized protein (UPF0335 family)
MQCQNTNSQRKEFKNTIKREEKLEEEKINLKQEMKITNK